MIQNHFRATAGPPIWIAIRGLGVAEVSAARSICSMIQLRGRWTKREPEISCQRLYLPKRSPRQAAIPILKTEYGVEGVWIYFRVHDRRPESSWCNQDNTTRDATRYHDGEGQPRETTATVDARWWSLLVTAASGLRIEACCSMDLGHRWGAQEMQGVQRDGRVDREGPGRGF
jgi:hypothetical protein